MPTRRGLVATAALAPVLTAPFAASSLAAQEAMGTHPIVGAWRWDNDPKNPGTDISYAIFHGDGTYIEVTAGGTNLGAWEATGERAVLLTAFVLLLNFDEDPATDDQPGTGILRLVAEVDDAGNTVTAPFSFEARDPTGAVVFTGDFEAIGTRIQAEPMVWFGTPIAGTPAAS